MDKQVIRSIRKGSVQWSEEDRLVMANMLVKAGYTVKIEHRVVPGQEDKKNGRTEYVIAFWEDTDAQVKD